MTSRLDRVTEERLKTIDDLRAKGTEPYPHSYHPSHTTAQARALCQQAGERSQRVSVAGRVTAKRAMGKMAFLDLRDGAGKLQASLRRDVLGDERYELLKDIDIGDFVGVGGELFVTRTGEITVDTAELVFLAKSLRPLPEKWHGLVDVETRYRQRYLDLISNDEARRTFALRSSIVSATRRFLEDDGYIEVETPVLQSKAGGALARPFVTHHHALDADLYLRIALELSLKKLIVGGIDRVYEMGRVFRNEGISIRHNPEFTLMECYRAYADYEDMMDLTERLFSTVARTVLGTTRVEFRGQTVELAPPWQRVTLREKVKELSGIDFEEYPDAESLHERLLQEGVHIEGTPGRGHLIDELISTFVEPKLVQPVFLLDYPVEMSPFPKKKRGNPRLVERFEAFICGLEFANAFTELNDPVDQRQRLEEQLRDRVGDEDVQVADEDFLEAMEYGMPPTGGLGIGIDRLVMLLTGQESIRDVILFPQLKGRQDA
ncbi:MAG: lysine--tRNA ligase [Dehalococcoidia bacterium]|jgi:lysyl-tRNA synthetase class 2|nr:lysine--tRNA ligase [Dehalococcoidia bacterium]